MTTSAEAMAAHPAFIGVLRHLARGLRGIYDENPRVSRTLASQQRWLLTQTAYALSASYDPMVPGSGLTTGRLKELITGTRAASHNTVLNFIEEMLTYRYVRYAQGDVSRRSRRLESTEISDVGMFRWFGANLAALDHLDGGARVDTLTAHPDLFRLAQPAAALACLHNADWREPPPRVALFLWTEAGGLVMDELIARIECADPAQTRLEIGVVETRAMASHFMMSRTHLQRLLKKASDDGSIGWHGGRKRGEMWLSRDFLMEYCQWQAIKFATIDAAFQAAATASLSIDHAQAR